MVTAQFKSARLTFMFLSFYHFLFRVRGTFSAQSYIAVKVRWRNLRLMYHCFSALLGCGINEIFWYFSIKSALYMFPRNFRLRGIFTFLLRVR